MPEIRRRTLGDELGRSGARVLGGINQGGGIRTAELRNGDRRDEYVPVESGDVTAFFGQLIVDFAANTAVWSSSQGAARFSTGSDGGQAIGLIAPDEGVWSVTADYEASGPDGETVSVSARSLGIHVGAGGRDQATLATGAVLNTYWSGPAATGIFRIGVGATGPTSGGCNVNVLGQLLADQSISLP